MNAYYLLYVTDKAASRILGERTAKEEAKTRGKMYCFLYLVLVMWYLTEKIYVFVMGLKQRIIYAIENC